MSKKLFMTMTAIAGLTGIEQGMSSLPASREECIKGANDRQATCLEISPPAKQAACRTKFAVEIEDCNKIGQQKGQEYPVKTMNPVHGVSRLKADLARRKFAVESAKPAAGKSKPPESKPKNTNSNN